MEVEALKLVNELGITGEHPDYPEDDWRAAVVNGDTRSGYWDWVVNEMRYEQHAWLDEPEPQ